MPRKSRALRLSQTQNLAAQYETAGLKSDRSYRFMNDMIMRLDQGKGLSKGQRNYLDGLIDQGVPKPKNEDRVKEILAAANVDGMQDVSSTLNDFAHKLGKGWSLSEKQESFLASLLAKAEKTKAHGRYRPCTDLIEDLIIASRVAEKKNSWYWQHRQGTRRAYEKVHAWLNWRTRSEELASIVESSSTSGSDTASVQAHAIVGDEPIIDEWSVNMMLKAAKKVISELKCPKHLPGEMRYYKGKNIALITGEPRLDSGGTIIYPTMVGGEEIETSLLTKRRSK